MTGEEGRRKGAEKKGEMQRQEKSDETSAWRHQDSA